MAVQWYERNGHAVLDRNWRCREGELDIVARCGDTIVFSEVKTRSSDAYGSPAEAVGLAKQRKIRRLALLWLRAHGVHAAELRFDVVAVLGNDIEVTRSAF
jgi:putative endonuclease